MRSVVHITLALCVVVATGYPVAEIAAAGEPHAATVQPVLHAPAASTATPRRSDGGPAPHGWTLIATPAPAAPPRTALQIVHRVSESSTASVLATPQARGPPAG